MAVTKVYNSLYFFLTGCKDLTKYDQLSQIFDNKGEVSKLIKMTIFIFVN